MAGRSDRPRSAHRRRVSGSVEGDGMRVVRSTAVVVVVVAVVGVAMMLVVHGMAAETRTLEAI